MFTTYAYYGCGVSRCPLNDPIQESADRLKEYYRRTKFTGVLTGENIDLLKLCIALGDVYVGFTFAFNKKEMYARVVEINQFTGRVFVVGGAKNARWHDNFLLKHVKKLRYPAEVYEEWKRSKNDLGSTR